jgi:hypothetical protein
MTKQAKTYIIGQTALAGPRSQASALMQLRGTLAFGVLAGIVAIFAVPLLAQYRSPDPTTAPPDTSLPTVRGRRIPDLDPAGDVSHDQRRLTQLNAIRQKSIRDDAAKLLRLAQELNASISNSGPTLSPEERMHRAAEIEKLAKQVKTKMSYVNSPVPDKFNDVTTRWP